jgi:hypothetical protein
MVHKSLELIVGQVFDTTIADPTIGTYAEWAEESDINSARKACL